MTTTTTTTTLVLKGISFDVAGNSVELSENDVKLFIDNNEILLGTTNSSGQLSVDDTIASTIQNEMSGLSDTKVVKLSIESSSFSLSVGDLNNLLNSSEQESLELSSISTIATTLSTTELASQIPDVNGDSVVDMDDLLAYTVALNDSALETSILTLIAQTGSTTIQDDDLVFSQDIASLL